MRSLVRVGDSSLLNSYQGDPGELAVDVERKALRVYDGSLGGGYEVLGVRAYEPSLPGPTELIAGDSNNGFFGEVTSVELISSDELTALIGLSQGNFLTTNPTWLKYKSNGSVVYTAKTPIKYGVPWSTLNSLGVVYGETTIGIGGISFKVRLMSGANDNPYAGGAHLNPPPDLVDRSEWNRLIVSVLQDGTAEWHNYQTSDLGIKSSGNAYSSWFQERDPQLLHAVLRPRGGHLVHGLYIGGQSGISSTDSSWGWRPVLEVLS